MDFSPLSEQMGEGTAGEGVRSFSDAFEDTPLQDWQQTEAQWAWLPGKNFLLRGWLKVWVQGTLNSRICGLSHPQFKAAMLGALSSQEQMFLAENPAIITSELATMCIFIDFAASVLGYPPPPRKWSALQGLVKHCGWIMAVGAVCAMRSPHPHSP